MKAATLHDSFLSVLNKHYLEIDKQLGIQTDFCIIFKEILSRLNLRGLTLPSGHEPHFGTAVTLIRRPLLRQLDDGNQTTLQLLATFALLSGSCHFTQLRL